MKSNEMILLRLFFVPVSEVMLTVATQRGRDRNVITSEDIDSRTVAFQLERDVFAGEEFYLDYGLTYDRSSYGPPSA